jgi:hypothetical protein
MANHHKELEQQRIALQQQVHALEPGETPGSNRKYKQLITNYKKCIDEEGGEERFGLEPGTYVNDLAIKSFICRKRANVAPIGKQLELKINMAVMIVINR